MLQTLPHKHRVRGRERLPRSSVKLHPARRESRGQPSSKVVVHVHGVHATRYRTRCAMSTRSAVHDARAG